MPLVILESSFINVPVLHANTALSIPLVLGYLTHIVTKGLSFHLLQLRHAILDKVEINSIDPAFEGLRHIEHIINLELLFDG